MLDVIDVIVIDREAYNQGKNAQFEPYIERSQIMPPLVARGPHAVAYCEDCDGDEE